jgi:histone H3/H4
MSFVVASALKEELKKLGMMTAGDFSDAMSAYVQAAAKMAAKRAKENGRVTVRPCDL